MNETSFPEWIAAIANIVTAVAVACGVYVARRQLDIWRQEARQKRQAEVAEDALVAVAEVDEALRQFRMDVNSVDIDDRLQPDGMYLRQRKLIDGHKNTFLSLRKAQISAESTLTLEVAKKISSDMQELLNIRFEISEANQGMLELPEEHVLNDRERESLYRMRGVLGEILFQNSEASPDGIDTRRESAVQRIRELLGPIARYETTLGVPK